MTLPGDYSTGSGTEEGSGSIGGGNPAWNEMLEAIPNELHSKVTPYLEKWDRGVQERFQKVQSDYEPWKEFISADVQPDTARFALNLLNSLNENPQMVYNAIGEYYKFVNPGSTQSVNQALNQGSSDQGHSEPSQEIDPYAGRLSEIERQNQIMAQVLVKQSEAREAAEADAKLDQELNDLRVKYGNYDERYVLAMMQNGMSGKDAVEHYFNWRESEMKQYRPKPLIMGGGGLVPGQNVDVRKMGPGQTKDLVVQMLQAAAEQNRE